MEYQNELYFVQPMVLVYSHMPLDYLFLYFFLYYMFIYFIENPHFKANLSFQTSDGSKAIVDCKTCRQIPTNGGCRISLINWKAMTAFCVTLTKKKATVCYLLLKKIGMLSSRLRKIIFHTFRIMSRCLQNRSTYVYKRNHIYCNRKHG